MEIVWQVVLFAVATTFTPGPNVVFLTASGANFGFRRTMPSMLGVCFGIPVLIIAVGAGLGVIFQNYPAIHWALRITGSAYLIWLAWKIAGISSIGTTDKGEQPISFFRAATFQWLNPKVWMMALSAIGTFTSLGGNMLHETLFVAAIFALVCMPAATTWTLFGVVIRGWLKSPRELRIFNLTMAALLLISVILPWFQ